ncbi:MAG: hypothetical protein KJO34_12985, partial [Deltaproteobacteria bacterium]|nr:hypothetical protein [Deltaproteobacteria bacterium]
LKALEAIALENGFHGFCATVLRENTAMIHVFKKRYPHLKSISTSGSEMIFHMDFEQAPATSETSAKQTDAANPTESA